MVIEQAITENTAEIGKNTAAIHQLIAAIAHGLPTAAAQVATVVADAPKVTRALKAEKGKPTADTHGSRTKEAASASEGSSAATKDSAIEVAATVPVTASISYDAVKAVILKLSQAKSREAASAVLAEFGVARGPDLKPGQFAAFIAKANESLAA